MRSGPLGSGGQPLGRLGKRDRRTLGDIIERFGRAGRGHDHPGARRSASGAIASACHWPCSSRGGSGARGIDAQATPLHSKASAPAAFQPELAAPARRARSGPPRPNVRECPVCINTPPLIANQG